MLVVDCLATEGILSDMTKKTSSFDNRKMDQFCIRTDRMADGPQQMYFLCYFYKQIV